MSKKITQREFLERFRRNYPDSSITPINYTAISNPLTIKCNMCGKEWKKNRAREFLKHYQCCGAYNEKQADKLQKIYGKNQEFDWIKQIDKDHYIVRHNKCRQEFKRTIQSGMDNPFSCKYCQTHKFDNMLSIQEVQNKLDDIFDGTIKILDYNGQLEKNHYKCLKCGLIFVQQHTCLLQSRGCPKCDKYKSQGEKKMVSLLEKNHLIFEEQVSVPDLPLQHFDFCIYNKDKKLQYYIEVMGEQHFQKVSIFRDSLEKIQERDERKREYCRKNNIPLYEIIYKKGKFLNLDILPLEFNDYPREGE